MQHSPSRGRRIWNGILTALSILVSITYVLALARLSTSEGMEGFGALLLLLGAFWVHAGLLLVALIWCVVFRVRPPAWAWLVIALAVIGVLLRLLPGLLPYAELLAPVVRGMHWLGGAGS